MSGIQYIVSEKGVKKAALIDLKKYNDCWEDIEDILTTHDRKNEPRIALEAVKQKQLKKRGLNV